MSYLTHTSRLVLAGSCLLVATAHAQVSLRVGPQVGGTHSAIQGAPDAEAGSVSARTGLEAGIVATLQVGHFAFQPAVLYAQRGFKRHLTYFDAGFGGLTDERVRLDYLSVPLRLAYTQHRDGRGLQVFAGPYLGLLVGGRREAFYTFPGSSQQVVTSVAAADAHVTELTSSFRGAAPFYSRRLDLGAQVGLGYQAGRVLLQVSYSRGLRDLGTNEIATSRGVPLFSHRPAYRNRSLQASLGYLFGGKS
jgi:hypothetical protein